jgi:LAO/AO transport system kinase
MRALFDRVLIESVGIGQSEADISFAVDSVILCVQPGSGDSLQFMKAGVMELPDIVVVTKADMGDAARRAKSEVEGALTLFERDYDWRVPVILASAATGAGVGELHQALADHRGWAESSGALSRRRDAQQQAWIDESIRARFGSEGLAGAGDIAVTGEGPFATELAIARELSRRLSRG